MARIPDVTYFGDKDLNTVLKTKCPVKSFALDRGAMTPDNHDYGVARRNDKEGTQAAPFSGLSSPRCSPLPPRHSQRGLHLFFVGTR